jgi:hypothetical protein
MAEIYVQSSTQDISPKSIKDTEELQSNEECKKIVNGFPIQKRARCLRNSIRGCFLALLVLIGIFVLIYAYVT